MKTFYKNETITKAIITVLLCVVSFLPTLSVYADESGEDIYNDVSGSEFEPWPNIYYGETYNDVSGSENSVEVYNDVSGSENSVEVYNDVSGSEVVSPSRQIAFVETPTYYYPTSYYNYPDYPTYTYNTSSYTYNYEPQPSCELSLNRSSIDEGDRVTLSWSTSNATEVSIDNGIGNVSKSGSRTVSPSSSRTYTLVAYGQGGSVWCSDSVTVNEVTHHTASHNDRPQCDSFTVSESRVDEGDEVTLKWRTTDADSVYINHGVGHVSDDGSERVTIDDDTTFTLTAENGSRSDTCTATVRVRDVKQSSSKKDPYCVFHIADKIVPVGGNTVLSWKTERTDRLVLKDKNGNVLADSRKDSGINERVDAITVYPTKSTTYTLNVYNGNNHESCVLDVTVNGVRGGVTLASVPYTGFEAGPVLTFVFYSAIVVWAFVLAYALVIRKRENEEVVAMAPVSVVPEEDWSLVHDVNEEGMAPSDTFDEVPANLPVMTEETLDEDRGHIATLESYAHAQYALISSDALRFIMSQSGDETEQRATLDTVIRRAKEMFPKEGDWIVINKERVVATLA